MARAIEFSYPSDEQISDEMRFEQVTEGISCLHALRDFTSERSTGDHPIAKLIAEAAAQEGFDSEQGMHALFIEEIARLRRAGLADVADRYWKLLELSHGVTRGFFALMYEAKEWETPAQIRRQLAIKSVTAKLAKDPKQLAKAEAFKLWQDWQSGKARYKSGAAFARHVVEVLPIENTKSVERWMKHWAAEARKSD